MDIYNLQGSVVALVQVKNRLSIPPDVVYQVIIDPTRFSPSRKFIHFDQRTQTSDLHGWFAVGDIEVIEALTDCDRNGKPMDSIYCDPDAVRAA